jgi:hypothetical protein
MNQKQASALDFFKAKYGGINQITEGMYYDFDAIKIG